MDGNLSKEELLTVNNSIIDKTLKSARKIAHNLLLPMLEEFGLKESIEELVDTFNNSKKIKNWILYIPIMVLDLI